MLGFEEIKDLLKKVNDENSRHSFYAKSIEIAKEIDETFSDKYPSYLKKNRPKETSKDKKYREDVFKNPAKSHRGRIIDKLIKVEQSEDYLKNYPTNDSGQNPLKDYCENGFNGYGNIDNWLFSVTINTYANDPNAVIAVFDKRPPERQTESFKPFPYIFKSDDVLFFERNNYCVLREKSTLSKFENTYYIFDDVNYYIFEEKELGGRATMQFVGPIGHNCGEMPVFKVGKYIKDEDSKGNQLYQSILSFTTADFQSAVARWSDLQVALVHHVHPLEWQMAPKKCTECKGTKKIDSLEVKGGIQCPSCEGRGYGLVGPLDTMYIEAFQDKFTEGKPSFPFNSPGGTFERDISAVKALADFYEKHIDDGYSAIDFGILRKKETNSAESGLSKQYNRLEFSQRIYSEGRHLIENILIPVYKFIDSQLFGLVQSSDSRLPEITIPISFDVMSPDMVLGEIELASKANVSKEIIGALEIKYSKLVFGEKSRETQTLIDEVNLNGLYGKQLEEVISYYGAGQSSAINGISEIDFIINASFKSFIDMAMREDINWHLKTETEKYSKLVEYANEIAANRPKMPELLNLSA